MPHPYTTFRLRLARHAVAQLAARLRSSAEIVALVLGPAILGLLAFAAMPAMLAAAQPMYIALPLLCLHGLLMSLPMALLRPLVAPAHVRAWLQALPLPPALRLRTGAAVAALLATPLALAYGASLSIWLLERPAWLLPLRAVAGTLFSCLLTWAGATWWLLRADRAPATPLRGDATRSGPSGSATLATRAARADGSFDRATPRRASASASASVSVPPEWFYLWRQLFWLPLWRNGNLAGPRQALLLAGTLATTIAWMCTAHMADTGLLATFSGILASSLLVLAIHEADSALRAQLARIAAAGAAWPIDLDRLARRARATLLAGAAVLLMIVAAIGMPARAWQHTAGHLWLLLACVSAPLLVLTPAFSARGRMALVACAAVLLCATGSKLWN